MLALLRRSPDLAALARRAIDPLIRRDSEHNVNLVKTLCAYLDSGGNAAKAAIDLGVSERTMHRRMNLIQELTGRDLRRPKDRAHLDLARWALLVNQDRAIPLSEVNG